MTPLGLVALGGAVQAGVDVLAAHDDDGVRVLGAQGGALGTIFLRVLADDVPVRQSGLKQTIPQSHADVVVCLVPRACRQDVGNQQRRPVGIHDYIMTGHGAVPYGRPRRGQL